MQAVYWVAFLSSDLPSMLHLLVPVGTSTHKHQNDRNIEGGGEANVLTCYNICDQDCGYKSNKKQNKLKQQNGNQKQQVITPDQIIF